MKDEPITADGVKKWIRDAWTDYASRDAGDKRLRLSCRPDGMMRVTIGERRIWQGASVDDAVLAFNTLSAPRFPSASPKDLLAEAVAYNEEMERNYLRTADDQDRSDAWKNARWSRESAAKHRRIADACRTAMAAMHPSVGAVTESDGVLWRDGRMLDAPEADAVARECGFMYAEQLVAHLAGMK